ncbi:MAG: putative CutA1 divalent ion tolerance protein [Microgenomates group bacterium Gr01-1014_5]|nr:MAG: putative CutA1 divalent ion tolerance protein [Microgenomates group bacterium Gr01-1014_5]
MTDILLVYITCDSVEQAKTIGKHLMKNRLCACVNIFPDMQPMFFWPPKTNQIDESKEVVLIAKTTEGKYQELEDEVHKIHTYDVPCVIAIPTQHISKKYYNWLIGELEFEEK